MLLSKSIVNQDNLAELRKKNNPKNEAVGDYTGRCKNCHSENLWDDNLSYGCNDCDFVRIM